MKYYLDTSIWLDLLEDRNEPNMPKGKWAENLLRKIQSEEHVILLSDNNKYEMMQLGYSPYEMQHLERLPFVEYIEATEKEVRRARDLASKRDVPKRDALHALMARDHGAVLITLDRHFQILKDICEPVHPKG